MHAAFLISIKDLSQRLRDRSAILVAIVVPLALAYIFNLALSGVTGGSLTFNYAIVNQDGGPLGQTFIDQVLADLERQEIVELRTETSIENVRSLAETGEVDAAFLIPQGFSQAVFAGQPASLEVIGNVDATLGTQVARSVAETYVADLTSVRVGVATVLHEGASDPAQTALLAARAAQVPSPVSLDDVSAASRELDPDTFYAAGMAVFFLFFTVQFGVSSLLEERNEGTLARLLAAPISRASILGGKLLTSFVLGIVSMTVLIVATMLLMGASWGNPLGVGLLVVAGVLAAVGIMGVVATLAKNAEQAGQWQSVIAVVLGLLGGAFFPVAQAGGFIASLSLLTPHAWFLRGLGDLAGGAGPAAVLPATAAMLVFAGVTGAIALLRLRRLAEL